MDMHLLKELEKDLIRQYLQLTPSIRLELITVFISAILPYISVQDIARYHLLNKTKKNDTPKADNIIKFKPKFK